MKKAVSLLLAAGIAFGALAGTASAATVLEQTVDGVIGVDYRYGGTTTNGFDCSGFTSYVFSKLGIELSRTSKSQAQEGVHVKGNELRAGDLVFFNTDGKGISHVGIYLANGQFAHASSKRGVSISSLSDSYYSKRIVTARRIMSDAQYQKFATELTPAPAVAAAAPAAPEVTAPTQGSVALATEQAELAAEEASYEAFPMLDALSTVMNGESAANES